MHSTFPSVTLPSSALIVGLLSIGVSPVHGQTRVTSLEELRQQLAAGDVVTVVAADGQPVAGRLMRVGNGDLDFRFVDARAPRDRARRDVTIALSAIQSLERRRDSVRNGVKWGAGIGAGFGGAMGAYALVIDRNDIDKWAGPYLLGTAVCTGIGALIGWAIDAARSKPHIRFDGSPGRPPSRRVN